MRLIEFTPKSLQTINEVAMNPTVFAQSMKQGESEGVKVGFEFEVCIPQSFWSTQNSDDQTDDDGDSGYDYDDDDDYDHDYEGKYENASNKLKSILKSEMNSKVVIFRDYHEYSKSLDRWYIEPDGSLSPNSNQDAALEVVGPPESPSKALDSLKKFFGIAEQYKFYSNNSTGLHINVSLPKDLDVLKLAVFTGDQYILKKFGRENNGYASGVMKSLTSSDFSSAVTKPNMSTEIKLATVQKIARDISRSHTASISFNGNYVSFRHTGGDYLKDHQDIVNVVGRFVRAMVIACDPTAYRNEYLAAVAKLVAPAMDSTSLEATIEKIKKEGLPSASICLYSKDHTPTIDDLNKTTTPRTRVNLFVSELCDIRLVKSGDYAKTKLIANSRPNGSASNAMSAAEPDKFSTFMAVPTKLQSILSINQYRGKKVLIWSDNENQGYYYVRVVNLPPTDPSVQAVLVKLRREAIRQRTGQ
jgi:hypothetical protein